MTEPENFIARWSRRKRAAAEEEEKPQTADPSSFSPAEEGSRAEGAQGGAAAPSSETRSPPPGSLGEPTSSLQGEVKQATGAGDISKQTEPAFDLSSLPPIESITAETDIRAFLAPGVPSDLARAALRRAWAADPKIRDFVGLSENAWDFNSPDAITGFGPLEVTDELRRLVNDMVGPGLRAGPAEEAAAPADDRQPPPVVESSTGLAANTADLPSQDDRTFQTSPDEPAAAPDRSQHRDEQPQLAEEHIAPQHSARKNEAPQVVARRPHGRALPE